MAHSRSRGPPTISSSCPRERSFEAELFKGAPQSSQLQPKVPHASRRHVLGAHQTVRVARHDSGHRLAEAGEAADLRSNGKRCT